MRVLLDENLPRDLAGELPDHQVVTVVGLGWSGVSNGELLRRATGRVDAFVTMDRSTGIRSTSSGWANATSAS